MNNNGKKVYNYTVILEKEAEGGYHAFCPPLKGCHSQGDTFEELLQNIYEAVEGCLSVDIDTPADENTQVLEIAV